jgi:type I restriction enzyme S subunit
LKYEQPTKYLSNNFNKDKFENKVPVLTANKSFILGYTDESEGVYHNFPVIIFDDFTTASRYIDFPFKVKSSAIKFLKVNEGFDLKFLFERLQLINHDISSHKRRWISEFQEKVIAIPSFEEQSAIADISLLADKEIVLLEKKLETMQVQKKGLMQVLLTGKKRLV